MKSIPLKKAPKRIIAVSVCFCTLLLSGCWDRTEINDLALVVATAIDKSDDDQIELSVQLINPKAQGTGQGGSGGQSGGMLTTVESVTGKTIFDARSKLQEKVARRLFWGHNRVIFFGEKIAEDGIRKHIDFFARHPFPRLRAFTFVTKGKAIDLLKVIPDLGRSSAEVARELANLRVGLSVTVKDLLQMLGGAKAISAVLPLIEVVHEPTNTMGLRVNGAAIFKDNKMVGQISDKMTRGVLWLRDEIDTASVTIKPENAEGYISFHLLRSHTVLIPKIENGKWKMIVKITSNDDAVQNQTKLNLMNPEIVKKLQVQLEQRVNKRIRFTLDQVQKEMNADIFGFYKAFHRSYPDQLAKVKWEEIFPEIEVEIKSVVQIKRPGRSTLPQGVPEDEVIGN